MGNTVVKNKNTGEKININNAKKASIKQGVKNITNTSGKAYTIVECNKKSYTNRFKNMGKGIGESMGKMGTSMKESTAKLAQSAKESAGKWGKKNNKPANNKKNNSIKITTTDIENVNKFFEFNSIERYNIYKSFSKNIEEYPDLKKIIFGIQTKYAFNIAKKLSQIYTEYNFKDLILLKTTVQRINNQPKNNQPINKNNVTKDYAINQQRLIKLFSTVYEYSTSNKYKKNNSTISTTSVVSNAITTNNNKNKKTR
jgi:hypothetical protein